MIRGYGVLDPGYRVSPLFEYAASALSVFFQDAGNCAFFYVFHRLFDVSLKYATDGRQPSSRKIEILHYIILGIIVAVWIAHWATSVNYICAKEIPVSQSLETQTDTEYSRSRTYVNLNMALNILEWVASAEVLFSFVPVVMNMMRKRRNFRVSSPMTFHTTILF